MMLIQNKNFYKYSKIYLMPLPMVGPSIGITDGFTVGDIVGL